MAACGVYVQLATAIYEFFSYRDIIAKVCTKCNEVFEYWGCLE